MDTAALGHKMAHTEAKAATCTADGNVEYWYCSVCKKYFSDEAGNTEITTGVTTTKTGHSYGDATYVWAGYDACTATKKCKNCDDTMTDDKSTITSDVTKAATCTETGTKVYTATFKDGFGTDTKEETLAKIAHDYGTPEYKWSEDLKTCTASKTCTACGDTVTEDATSTSEETTAATCTKEGVTTYTAKFTKEGFTEQTKTAAIAKIAHTLEKTEAKAATCTATGNNEYYTCSVCKGVFKDDKAATSTTVEAETLAKIAHSLEKTAAKAATCTATGNNEYYTCSVCKGVFKDDKAATSTTVEAETLAKIAHSLEKTAAKAATCTATGNNEYYTCSVCKGVFKDDKAATSTTVEAETLAKIAHIYGEYQYAWTGVTSCKATKTCSVCKDEVSETSTSVTSEITKAATCTVDGETTYTAVFATAGLTSTTTAPIAALGHTEEVIPAIEATADSPAYTAGKKCSVCGEILVPQAKITQTEKKNDDGTVTNVQTYTAEEKVGSDEVKAVMEKTEGSDKAAEVSVVIKSSETTVSEETVKKALDLIKDSDAMPGSEASEKKTVTIDTSVSTEEKKTAATISKDSLQIIKDAGAETEIKGNLGTLKISQAAAETLISAGSTLVISTESSEKTVLTEAETQKVGADAAVFKLSALVDNHAISKFNGNISVTLPYALSEGKAAGDVVVCYIDDTGRINKIDDCTYADGYVTFNTDHFSYWAITDSWTEDEVSAFTFAAFLGAFIAAMIVIAVGAVSWKYSRDE